MYCSKCSAVTKFIQEFLVNQRMVINRYQFCDEKIEPTFLDKGNNEF